MRSGRFKIVSGLLCAGLLVGCSGSSEPKPDPNQGMPQRPVVADLEHRVETGETLAVISNWYTGSPNNWSAIRSANPGLNPNRLRLGQVIVIPGELIVRREPIPRSYVKKGKSQAQKSSGNIPPSVTVDSPTDAAFDDGMPKQVPNGDDAGKAADDFAKSVKPADAEVQLPVDPPAPPPALNNGGPGSQATIDDLFGDAPAPSKNPVTPPAAGAVAGNNPPAQGGDKPSKAGGTDAEREKLLDELLSQ